MTFDETMIFNKGCFASVLQQGVKASWDRALLKLRELAACKRLAAAQVQWSKLAHMEALKMYVRFSG